MKIVNKMAVQIFLFVSVLWADTSCYEKYCSNSITGWYNIKDTMFHLINGCQLAGLAKLVNEGVDDFSGKKIYLDYDIDLRYSPYVGVDNDGQSRSCSWTPIGNQWTRRFRGEFDGQNNTISGLNIDAEANYRGFFGFTENAIVKRTRFGKRYEKYKTGPIIYDARYTSISNVYSEMDLDCSDVDHCGGIVGYGAPANLYNDTVKANVRGRQAGGIVGVLYEGYDGKHSVVKIENCYFEGNVEGMVDAGGLAIGLNGKFAKITNSIAKGYVKAHEGNVGGIVASMKTGLIQNTNYIGDVIGGVGDGNVICSAIGGIVGDGGGEIIYSNAKGNVFGNCFYAGGLVGRMEGNVSNSISSSYHIGKVLGKMFAGGIAGKVYGRIYKSYAEGDVIIDSAYSLYDGGAGGVAGFADSVVHSYHKGNVIGSAYYIGGLVGKARMVVDSSYHSDGNVMGTAYVGGLVGKIDYGVISNSYSITDSITADSIVGGLVGSVGHQGYLYNGSYTNYSSAKVIKSFSAGNVYGCSKVGGLVGLLNVEGDSLIQSYSINNIYGLCRNSEKSNFYIGGLVGYGFGVIQESYASGIIDVNYDMLKNIGCIVGFVNDSLMMKNVYYDSTNCVWSVISGDSNKVSVENSSGKSTDEMFSKYSFENWDFVNVWFINENMSYPYLRNDDVFNAVISTEDLSNLVYNNGRSIEPKVLSVVLSNDTLVVNKDYKVSYENNNKIGKGLIKVCGNENYKGCRDISFDIKPIPVTPYFPDIENQIYTGDSIKPVKKVYNGSTLISDQYYSIEYENNLNAGVATALVSMKGVYVGQVKKTFVIEKKTPQIIEKPVSSNLLEGDALQTSALSRGVADVNGEFVWKNSDYIPSLDIDSCDVIFFPDDFTNYNLVEFSIPIKVLETCEVVVRLNDVTLDSIVVVKNSSYSLPRVPDSIGYDFDGFYNGKKYIGKSGHIYTISKDVLLDAVYKIKKYVISYVNESSVLQLSEWTYGTIPTYNGEIPSRKSTAQWTYIFKGWNPAVSSVVSSATYTAVFDSVVNKYEVVFKDYDGSILKKAVHYDYGTRSINIDRPTIPTRPESAKNSYTFKGWTPALADVTDNVVYTAEYDSTIQSYTITFVSESKEIQSGKVAYGTTPSYKGETPTKNVASQFNYSFKGWSPSITPVSKNMTYTAVFDSTVKKYTVTFMNGSKTLQVIRVAHGSLPRYTGEIPTMASTKNYSYEFAGWNPKIENAAGEATYQAVFDSTKSTEIKDCLFSNMEMSVRVNSRIIQIAAAPIGSAYAILDMQGRVLKNGRIESANFNLAMSQAGHYLVRIGDKTQRVNVK